MTTFSVPITIAVRAFVSIPDDLAGPEREAALFLAPLIGSLGLTGLHPLREDEDKLWFEKASEKFGISVERIEQIATSLEFAGRDEREPARLYGGGSSKARRGQKMRRMSRRANQIRGNSTLFVEELLSPSFMKKHTSYDSFEAFLEAGGRSGYERALLEGRATVCDADWDEHVAANTRFSNWGAMKNRAVKEWTTIQLDL